MHPRGRGALSFKSVDGLVLSFVRSEGLVEGGVEGDPAKQTRDKCEAVKELMLSGAVLEAIELAQQIEPNILNDTRLKFRLYKQHFVELLRHGTDEATAKAIVWSRDQLAPCALDAYLEAYSEFKRCMLMLLYGPAPPTNGPSPVSAEWEPSALCELAHILWLTLRQATRVRDPLLRTLLQHLLNTQRLQAAALRRGASLSSGPAPVSPSEPESHLLEALLPKERGPPPLPREGAPAAFAEADVQHLVLALGCGRQAAVEALKHTSGDTSAAFMQELMRLRLSTAQMDALVLEYGLCRGLLTLPAAAAEGQTGGAAATAAGAAARAAGASAEPMEADGRAESHEAASISGGGISSGTPRKAGALPVWRGRRNTWLPWGTPAAAAASKAAAALAPDPSDMLSDPSAQHKYRSTCAIRDQIDAEGLSESVLGAVQALDPGFFDAHPRLLFDLRRAAFAALVRQGDAAGALALARAELGPLTVRFPGLVHALKPTLMALLRPTAASSAAPAADVLASALQDALAESLGLAEPRLAGVLRAALTAHADYFARNRCEDPFRACFGGALDALRQPDAPTPTSTGLGGGGLSSLGAAAAAASSGGQAERSGAGDTQVDSGAVRTAPVAVPPVLANPDLLDADDAAMLEDEMDEGDEGDIDLEEEGGAAPAGGHAGGGGGGGEPSEASVLTLMEFMALSRADALALLAQYEGNVELAMHHLLA